MDAKFNHLFILLAAASLAACDAGGPGRKAEGQYGASSGPNPNLADLQRDKFAPPTADAAQEPPAGVVAPQPDAETAGSSAQADAADAG